ncbi:hypothetical protein PCE1_004229 [Barthelona sp. PCE]
MARQHGSLAHTGKVRNSCPDAPKMEKRAPKTGRSKLRSLYNKRFLSTLRAQNGRELTLNARERQIIMNKIKGREEE